MLKPTSENIEYNI